MTALLVGRLRELATQTHLLEKKVDALGWMAANGPEQAQQQALTMRNPLELPAAQPKSRSTARRFAGVQKLGAASLGSILRGA